MNFNDPLLIVAALVAAFLVYRRIQANRAAAVPIATIQATPLGPVQHEGHALYAAFEACKKSAIGDKLKTTLGEHGAGQFMTELGTAVTGKAPEAPKS